MKRSRKRNHRRIEIPPKYILLGLSILCVLLMILSLFFDGFFKPVRNFTNSFIQPMQKGVNSIGSWTKSKTDAFQNYDELIDENAKLKEQLITAQTDLAKYQHENYELQRLQDLYDLDMEYEDYKKTAARVISKDTSNWFSSYYIDKGSADGIQKGCNVLYDGGLCGIVTDVGEDYAVVRSIIDDTSNVNAMILPSEAICNVSGSINNYNSGYLIAQNIEKDSDISIGDQIVTSYVSDKYLPGITIGYISKIENDSNNLTKTAYITPTADFSRIQEVLVILDLKKTITE